MHESGTRGPPQYGIVHQMPLTTFRSPVNIFDNSTYRQNRTGNDTARVGYFSTNLANGIIISLSGTRHSGIIQYDNFRVRSMSWSMHRTICPHTATPIRKNSMAAK